MQRKKYNIGLGYIESIKDPFVRQIIFNREIKGMKWSEIAETVKGGNSPETVRGMYKRYIEKHPPGEVTE